MAVVLEKLTLMNASRELGATALFLAGGRTWTVDDAIAAAMFRGELDPEVAETLALADAEDRAEAEGVEPDEAALQASSERFRYEHNLISAGETEEWLEARGLSTADFSGWLYQNLCSDLSKNESTPDLPSTEGYLTTKTIVVASLQIPRPLRSAQRAPDEEIDDLSDLLRVHLWMSDKMEALSTRLSRRVAADLEMAQRGEQPATPANVRLPAWLGDVRRDRNWFREMLRMEAAFDRLSAGAITDEARKRKLGAMQLSLAKIELESLDLDTEPAAREAFLCVHDDGSSISDVARETGSRSERGQFSLDMLDEKISQRLFNAREGEVIGPIESGGRFKIYQVLRKLEPSVEDPGVVRRIDEAIVDEFFDGLCARHVQAGDVARTGK
ncbi:MAG: peptidylprolyl isomerase [Thermoanaerobaculia bacterium]